MNRDSVKVKNKGNIDYSKSLKQVFDNKKFRAICAQVIVKGMKDGINKGQDIKGQKFKRLRASTVRQKRKKGYNSPSKPLVAKGIMRKLPPVINKADHAEINVAKSRADIAGFHNEGTPKMPKREWFGVTIDAKQNIARAIAKKFVAVLKKNFKPPSKL